MRPLMAILLASMMLLAGCAESEDPVEATDDHDDPVDVDQNATDDVDVETNNTAPVALLTASVENGTAPLAVEFTLDGSDADGDNLTYVLSINGNETQNGTLPAVYNATFEAGNHSILLVVSDGNLTGETNLTVVVAPGQVEEALPPVEPIFVILEMVEGCWLCVDANLVPTVDAPGAEGCAGWRAGQNEMDCGWVAFGPEYQGHPFSMFSYTSGTIAPFGSDGEPDYEFYDKCESGATLIEQNIEHNGDTVIGTIPEGAGCLVGFEFHWPNVGHTIEFSIGAVAHGE